MLLVLAIPFSIVLALTTQKLSEAEKDNAYQYLSSNLQVVSSTLDQVLKNLEFSHSNIFIDKDFLTSMKRLSPYDSKEDYTDYKDMMAIKNRINQVAATNDSIHSIYAYSFTAERIFSSNVNWNPDFNYYPPEDSPWVNGYFSSDSSSPWVITKEIQSGKTILSSYREIWVYGDEQPSGLLSINMDARDIALMMQKISPNPASYSFILDRDGHIIAKNMAEQDPLIKEIVQQLPTEKTNGSFDFKYDKDDIFVSYHTSDYSGFQYVIATSLSQIQTTVPIMVQLIVLFLILLIIMLGLAMFLVHHYFFTPTAELFAGMKQVQQGDFSVQLPPNPTHEFGYINENFNQMVESIDSLINENYARELVNKEAELRNIQNQLNEHFLYNTLDSIHWLARLEDAPRTCDMVFALANFYRLSLSSGHDVIPVTDVIQLLENYLYIQRFRIGDHLSYSIACEAHLENQKILKTTLQPIVENAVLHGIGGLTYPGRIEITFTEVNDKMRVSVKDNGHGFTPEQLEKVQAQLDMRNPYVEHSFALKTIQSQLQVFYGIDISLQIETVYGKGTTVWFDLPIY